MLYLTFVDIWWQFLLFIIGSYLVGNINFAVINSRFGICIPAFNYGVFHKCTFLYKIICIMIIPQRTYTSQRLF